MYFVYLKHFCIKVPAKFENIIEFLEIFGSTIFKCKDINRKSTQLLAHSLYSILFLLIVRCEGQVPCGFSYIS